MKTLPLTVILCALALPTAALAAPPTSQTDETSQFIFFSVLEGLYEDGLSTEDVARILMKREKESYFHFIYSCPVCNATIWALEAYQARPPAFYGLKKEGSTFGPGLAADLSLALRGDKPLQRLTAIHTLVQRWIERRMTRMNLPGAERAALVERLGRKRQEGMDALERLRRKAHGSDFSVEQAAPAYAELKECAVCNAAAGKPMKLPE
jgi:hypothetical protein